VSSSYGPPGWAEPTTTTAPEPALAPQPEPDPPQAADGDWDVYIRPEPKELPEWTPPATAPAFVATVTPGHARVPEDRRAFDGRRVRAYFIDSLCIGAVPLLLNVASVITDGAALVFAAITLIYYFLCEATTGQTVGKRAMGLRVVALDGSPATAKAISARTVLRVIDMSIVGLIVWTASGRRRQRLGDLLAGTVVVDATPDPGPPPKSVLTMLYPIAWLASAITVFSLIGHGGDVYLSDVDDLCKEANAIVAQAPASMRDVAALDVAQRKYEILRSARPPFERRALHSEILSLEGAAIAEARGPQPRSTTAATALRARYAQLGLEHCAR
jgi:uncharacterized RDD family membrane protein YckC